jgi:hypothetical protein
VVKKALVTMAIAALLACGLALLSVDTMAAKRRVAIIPAASCSQSAVQSALNSASDGDTVTVPAGSCSWTSAVEFGTKEVTLQGAGIGSTNITCNGGGQCIGMDPDENNFERLTAFTFIAGVANSNGAITVHGCSVGGCMQDGPVFRIDHIRWLTNIGGGRGIYINWVAGLIDHVTFDQLSGNGSVQLITIEGSSVNSDGGYTPWTHPTTLGTNKAVYIEDNSWTCNNSNEDAIDVYTGGRWVARYNTFRTCTIGTHGTDSGFNRSTFSAEVYNNTWTTTSNRSIGWRGGTGVAFNNSASGGGSIGLWNYRSCPRDGSDTSSWDTCDGTNYAVGSTDPNAQASRETHPTTGAASSSNVLFCSGNRDQTCTATSQCSAAGTGTCTAFFDGTGTAGYPCRDQVGRGHGQTLDPVYLWNNTNMGGFVSNGPATCSPTTLVSSSIIVQGRDWFDGSTPKPGYTSYTYPHPLITGEADPLPPTLTISAPAATSETTSSPLTTLAGTCSDSDGTISSVTWSNNQGGSGTATGTTSWSVASVALTTEAVNVITVTCTDDDTLTDVETVSVLRVTVPGSPDDTFTRGTWATLGPNWTTQTTLALTTASSQALATSTQNRHCSLWNAHTLGDNQYSQVTVIGTTSSTRVNYVSVRSSGTSGNYSQYNVTAEGTSSVISKIISGVRLVLQTINGLTWTSGDVLRLEVVGSTLRAYRNGAQIGTDQASGGELTAGAPGICGSGSAVMDTFVAGSIGTARLRLRFKRG